MDSKILDGTRCAGCENDFQDGEKKVELCGYFYHPACAQEEKRIQAREFEMDVKLDDH